jgi:hypothetical protein
MRKVFVTIATVVALTLGMPALATGDPASVAAAADDDAPKPTPVEAALGRVSKQTGLLSKQAALRLFETMFGDVPGVKAPPNRVSGLSGTLAVRAVMSHFDEYTPRQQRAIERLLEPPPGSVSVTVPPAGGAQAASEPSITSIAYVARPVPTDLIEPTVQTAAALRRAFAGADRLGFDIPNLTMVFLPTGARRPAGGPRASAWTEEREPGSPNCRMFLPAETVKSATRNALVLAHEIFHCFQSQIEPNYTTLPGWILDGQAEYAASEVQRSQTSDWWAEYSSTPTKSLFKRTYDALGFYEHLHQIGINPYKVMPAMLRDGTNVGAYQASGAASDRFLDSWASGYFLGDVAGEDWDMLGPRLAKHRQKATPVTVAIGRADEEGQPFAVPFFTNSIYALRVRADVVDVDVDPGSHVRISDGTTDTIVPAHGQFCTRPGGCACPSGDGAGEQPIPLKRNASLAISGGTDGSDATVRGTTLAELCCAGPSSATTVRGLTVIPRVDCQKIGVKIEKDGDLKLNIGFALTVDHPRIRPHFATKKGKKILAGVDLEGIRGIVLDFGAGAASGAAANQKFRVKVPVTVEVPVHPREKGLPSSIKVEWTILVQTAITGNNSTLLARARYGLAGRLGVRKGAVSVPSLGIEESLIDSINGITLGPSGIVIAVKTRFVGGAGTPASMKRTFASLTSSFGVTNGSAFASPLVVCRGSSLSLVFAAGGGGLAATTKKFIERMQVLPDVPLCQGG